MVQGLQKRMRSWFEVDLRALALMRIGFALTILLDLGLRAWDLTAFYTEQGIMPRGSWGSSYGAGWKICLHLAAGTREEAAVLFLFHAAWAVALLLGWRTTLSTVVSWLMAVSLHWRQVPACNGGDSLLRAMLFWGIFLPWGAVWSLDARRRQTPAAQPAGYFSFASCALVLQLCLIYWVPVALRSSPLWWNGEAVHQTLLSHEYATDWGMALTKYPTLLKVLGISVIYGEVFGPLLLFSPFFVQALRGGVVGLFVLLHLGMMATMELGLFPLICIVSWLGLLPTWCLDRAVEWWTRMTALLHRTQNGKGEGGAGPAPSPIPLSLGREAFVGACLVLILLGNLETVDRDRYGRFVPPLVKSVMNGVRLPQNWALFTPGPPRIDGYFAAVATLKDGSKVDLIEKSPTVRQRQTKGGGGLWVDLRWRKYLGNMIRSSQASADRLRDRRRFDFLNYLVKEWNQGRDPERRVSRVALTYVWRPMTSQGYGDQKTATLYQAVWNGTLRQATTPKPAASTKPGSTAKPGSKTTKPGSTTKPTAVPKPAAGPKPADPPAG